MKQKGSIVPLVLFLITGVSLILLSLSLLLPYWQTKNYLEKSKLVHSSLTKEIKNLKEENFLAGRNITKSLPEAKLVLKKHQSDLNLSKENITKLMDEYDSLTPSTLTKNLHRGLGDSLELSQGIITKYEATLSLRDKVFFAFGEELPEKMEQFLEVFYRGGDRADFILITLKISELAEGSVVKMNNITPPPDELEQFTLRKENFIDIRDTFRNLYDLYRLEKVEEASSTITAFSSRTEAFNEKVPKSLDNFINKSSIAQDFISLESLEQEIDKEFVNTQKYSSFSTFLPNYFSAIVKKR